MTDHDDHYHSFNEGQRFERERIVAIIKDVAEHNPLSRGTAEVLLKKLGAWPGWTNA